MKFNKKFLATALLASTLLMTGCGQANIGYIDVAKVEETPQMTAIIDEGHKKIQELQEQNKKDSEGKSEEEVAKLQEDFQRKAMGIQQSYDTQLKHKLDTVLDEISKSKEIGVVIESSKDVRIVISGGIDLTDEVVKKLQ